VRASTPLGSERAQLAQSCTQALVALLQSNGGFPGRRGDDTTRQMVREIRRMYSEIDRPTPEPEPSPRDVVQESDGFDLDPDLDLEDIEEVYGS